jgi:hypothetical protein
MDTLNSPSSNLDFFLCKFFLLARHLHVDTGTKTVSFNYSLDAHSCFTNFSSVLHRFPLVRLNSSTILFTGPK